jgi:hypothetical protein
LGVGSQSNATASAMASTRSSSNSNAPVKRIATKRYTTGH